MRLSLRLILLIFAVCLTACEGRDGSEKDHFEALIVEYDFSNKKYKLVKKTFYSLSKPRDLDSKVAQIFYRQESDVDLDYENPVKLNLVKSESNTYLPEDISTLSSLSTYLIYEKYYNFHKKLDILNFSTWPKKVVVEAVHEKIKKNNALHAPTKTSTYYLPFDPANIPGHLNPGIIAHEENHGLFYQQVVEDNILLSTYDIMSKLLDFKYEPHFELDKILLSKKLEVDNAKGENFNVMLFNQVFVEAINEGMADYAGFVFSNEPNFLQASFTYEKNGREFNRTISKKLQDPLPAITDMIVIIEGIERQLEFQQMQMRGLSGDYLLLAKNLKSLKELAYGLGGQLSSMLLMLSDAINPLLVPKHISNKQEFMYKIVTEELKNFGNVVGQNYRTKRISFNNFFNQVLHHKIFNNKMCELLKAEMSGPLSVQGCVRD